jgi:lysyl-tRNA synthetase class 2
MTGTDWRPTTNLPLLHARAELSQQIREFFRARQVLEVETPLLASAIGTDPALDPVRAQLHSNGGDGQNFFQGVQDCFLQTSPEFPMKRLLAAGSGPIYQLSKAFRNGEAGNRHNPEFTLLEWYRPGFTLAQLMTEVDELLAVLLQFPAAERVTYSDLFQRHLGIDPLAASLECLKKAAQSRLDVVLDSTDPDTWLDLLFSHCIEPALQEPVFIHDYPPSQAALAVVEEDEQGRAVARRFELVAGGMELANGYLELTDANLQRQRFQADSARRKAQGLPVYPVDEYLLAALEHGLESCAGVAVGVDRLLMLKTGVKDIRKVISFPADRI